MANTYHQIYLQVVFAVKYREGKLHKEWREKVYSVIGNLINETGCKTIKINGVEDHIHIFFGLKPTVSIPELMRTIKAKSSKYINEEKLTKSKFEWQDGYGVFSYSHSHIHRVYKYIENQEKHHQKKKFKEEYIEFLTKFNIDYKTEYVFEELK